MEFSEACEKMVEELQRDEYIERLGLMLMTFINALDNGDTNAMALALAKQVGDDDG